jgi:hypothetical protein
MMNTTNISTIQLKTQAGLSVIRACRPSGPGRKPLNTETRKGANRQ